MQKVNPILLTKLHRPPITPALLPRLHLLERLDRGRQRPLTLISAPAGYGKSILASTWLETCDCPSAWLSLDEHDNDLVDFLTYLTAAVQSMFAGAVLETQALLRAPITPPSLVLARSLANDLERLETAFILALDDYHHINEMALHELLNELLRHPPRSMHLLITSRGDPPLNLDRLRAQGQMTEIRLQDLSFTLAETHAFMNDVMGFSVDRTAASRLRDKTEGWATGLRLAALSLRQHGDVEALLGGLQADSRYLQDYLAVEVISQQPPEIQDWLLKTSILDRFCAPLCLSLCSSKAQTPSGSKGSAVGHTERDAVAGNLSGRAFLEWLERAELFCVPLDHRGDWFRFHHLFQQLLQQQLGQRMGVEEVAGLHARASSWFAENDLIDEALQHALTARDPAGAAELVEGHWHTEAEAARWHVVESWLARLPAGIKQQRPALLLAEAFGALASFQLERVPPLLEQAGSLLDDRTAEPLLLGELNFFRGTFLYWQGDAEMSVRLLEEALAQGDEKHTLVQGNLELMLGLARHTSGQKAFAIQALNDRIRAVDPSEVFLLGHLISGLAFIHLLSGELAQAGLQARRMQTVNKRIGNATTDAWGWYFRACTSLHAYNLDRAVRHFAVAVQQQYSLDTRAVLDALAGLALAQQLMQQPDDAAETLDRLLAFARELGEPQYLSVARSCQARLSLLRGDLRAAVEWQRSVCETPAPPGLFIWLEIPCITQARVLIAAGSPEFLEQATGLLRTLRQQSEASHFTCQTIEVAVLQSLALERQGRSGQALVALEEAVALADPGGWILPFVELGQPMAELLSRLKVQDAASGAAIDRILAAFPEGARAAALGLAPISLPTPPLLEPLTVRELETLRLLATDLSTREIAAELVVAVTTLRTHARSIYGKLDAHSRFQAVQRAKELGLL